MFSRYSKLENNFLYLMEALCDISLRKFGSEQKTEGTLTHLEKEIQEVREDPDNLIEWADCIILAIDGALRRGHEPKELLNAIWAKLQIIDNRMYPDARDNNESIEHIKGKRKKAFKD